MATATAIKPEAIRPQRGPQEAFLSTAADIAVYGGAAGSGKSWALLMEPLRHVNVPGFGAVIFRREYPQITNEGGLWDSAEQLYRHCGARAKETTLEWSFPLGPKIKFAHMQYEKDRHQWDGAQIPFLGFDQLEHFTWRQFWYMLSRNRTMCGVKPYIRATCNPDPDHWLRSFMAWWIDDETGLPIHERSGSIRWFVVRDNEPDWADTATELIERHGESSQPKSFTFIAGSIHDNPALLDRNPEYLANLQALPKVDRERLLYGNWNARDAAGMFFRRSWFPVIEASPSLMDCVRYWDRAGTEAVEGSAARGSWTAGVRMGVTAQGEYVIDDVERFQGSPMAVATAIKNMAGQDGSRVRIGIEQDPGQAGKAEAESHIRNLAGFNVMANAVRESKGLRARPLSAQTEAGNVKLVRGAWNDAFLRELENFDGSGSCVSDQVDAASGAFHLLTNERRGKSFVYSMGQGAMVG